MTEEEIARIERRYAQPISCSTCCGSGEVSEMADDFRYFDVKCPDCHGAGDKPYPMPTETAKLIAALREARADLHETMAVAITTEEERDALRAKLESATEALMWIGTHADCECDPGAVLQCVGCAARAALAKIGVK